MSHTAEGYISAPIDVESDLGTVLGTGSGDVGTNCTSNNIRLFSKHKPNPHNGYESPNDSTIANNKYYIVATGATLSTQSRNADYVAFLTTANTKWTREGAVSPYYRVLDFDKYFQSAPEPFMQADGTTLELDLVGGISNALHFYIFMNTGILGNKAFSQGLGINQHATRFSSNTYVNASVAAEELQYTVGGEGGVTVMGANVGIVIYNSAGTQFVTQKFSEVTHAISDSKSEVDNDMFILNLEDLASSLSVGTYTAVACARKQRDGMLGSFFYLPACNTNSSYPAVFTLKVGGLDNYKFHPDGVADSTTDDPAEQPTITESSPYIFVKFKNESGHSISITTGSNPKFYLWVKTRIRANRTAPWSNLGSRKTDYIRNSSDINIVQNGGEGTLIYRLQNIWWEQETGGGTNIDSGTQVEIVARLFFGYPSDSDWDSTTKRYTHYGAIANIIITKY